MAQLELPGAARGSGGNVAGRTRGKAVADAGDVRRVPLTRDPGVRVPDFTNNGAEAIGKGIQQAVQGVGYAMERQQRQYDANETSKAELDLKEWGPQELRRLTVEDDPTRPDFMKSYDDSIKERNKAILSGLNEKVSPDARERLSISLEAQRVSMRDAAGQVQLVATQKKSVDLLAKETNIWSAQASRDPDSLPFILEDVKRKHATFAGTMTADMERDQLTKSTQAAVQSAVSGYVKMDRYAEAEKLMASGQYDADLGPEAIRHINADIHRGKTSARMEIREVANDHLASLSATGIGVPGLSEKATKVLDPKDLQDFKAREATARNVFKLSGQMKFATPAEMAAGLTAIAPKPGSTRFADEQQIHAGLTRQAQQMLKARTEDPMGYSMQAPEVAEAFKQAGENPALLPFAIQKSLALQEQMGIPSEERRVLTKSGAESEVARLNAMPPEKMAEAMQGLQKVYGKHWSAAYRELVSEKLPTEAIVLGTLDLPSDAVARKDMATAIQTGRKTLTDNLGPTVKTEVDRHLAASMEPWARTELSRGAHDANVQAMRSSAEMLAYSYASRGLTPQRAAEQAASQLALGRYDIIDQTGFSLYAPKGLGQKVSTVGTGIVQSLKPEDLMDPGGEPKLTPAERQAQYLNRVKAGRWVLDKTGTGAMLLDDLGQPAMSADTGKPITFGFDAMDSLITKATTAPRNPQQRESPFGRAPAPSLVPESERR